MDKRKTKDGWLFLCREVGFRSKIYKSPEKRDEELEKYNKQQVEFQAEILKRQKEEKILLQKYD